MRAGRDDGVPGSNFADSLRHRGLDTLPAVRIALFGLVQDFKEDVLGIDGREVSGQFPPH